MSSPGAAACDRAETDWTDSVHLDDRLAIDGGDVRSARTRKIPFSVLQSITAIETPNPEPCRLNYAAPSKYSPSPAEYLRLRSVSSG